MGLDCMGYRGAVGLGMGPGALSIAIAGFVGFIC